MALEIARALMPEIDRRKVLGYGAFVVGALMAVYFGAGVFDVTYSPDTGTLVPWENVGPEGQVFYPRFGFALTKEQLTFGMYTSMLLAMAGLMAARSRA